MSGDVVHDLTAAHKALDDAATSVAWALRHIEPLSKRLHGEVHDLFRHAEDVEDLVRRARNAMEGVA